MSTTSALATSAASSAIGNAAPAAAATRADIKKAAQQFEAILTRQMLAAARKTDLSGGMLSGEGVNTFREMQDARFADITAKKGTLGFAKMIEAQLLRQTNMTAAATPAATPAATAGTTVKGG